MKGYYDEWKSITNTVEDLTEAVYSFGRGLRQVGLDTLEDAIHMGNLLYGKELQATGQEVPEELQADATTFINNLRSGISNTITDPGNTIEAIGQNIFETVDEEGLAYAAGYIAPEVAIALATKKMTGKGPKVTGGTGVADDVLEEGLEGGLYALLTPSSKVLRQNLIDAGVEVPDYPNAAHHIVAGSSPKAAEARAILQKYGVDINDAANGTFMQ